jgi:hypothetical protein
MSYDLVIIGGGISGLRVGIESLKKKPGIRCCILEKYGYIGGRVVTYRKNIPGVGKVQWENGAGRISTSHKKVLGLMKKYGLTFVPIGDSINFIAEENPGHIQPNNFTELIDYYLGPISGLPADILATHTLGQLLDSVLGPKKAEEFYIQFPYYSEVHTLRADMALESFDKEMGTYDGFGVCKEGLSALIDGMVGDFTRLGGEIIKNTEIVGVRRDLDGVLVDCKSGVVYSGKAVVLALHRDVVKGIRGVNGLAVLKHLEMTPLLRTYAVFPVKGGKSWFSGMNKIVTDSPIRYILPMDASRGIVMISYTDGADAEFWLRGDLKNSVAKRRFFGDFFPKSPGELEKGIMKEIRRLFPDMSIPDPIFFKQHPWYEGCTYWKPGLYNVEDESIKSLWPLREAMPGLFMCNESFAVHQCWMESAIDQADKLLGISEFKGVLSSM